MLHVPILDARRGYVFGAIYDQDNSAIFSPKHIKLEELLQELQDKENYIFITNGYALIAYQMMYLKVLKIKSHTTQILKK